MTAPPPTRGGGAPWYRSGGVDIHVGNVLDVLAQLPAGSCQTVVTSPPYYGLRSYNTAPVIWGGSSDCDHMLEAAPPGKMPDPHRQRDNQGGLSNTPPGGSRGQQSWTDGSALTLAAPGKVLTGGTGPASAKQTSNAGSQYGNAWVEETWYRQGGGQAGSSSEAFSEPGAANAARLKAARWRTTATCTRCGAWRGELGSEPLPDCLAWARGVAPCSVCFVCHLVVVFRAVRRVLHDSGTCWVNLGDSYSSQGGHSAQGVNSALTAQGGQAARNFGTTRQPPPGLGPKQLLMMPARVALALQADGWVLRSAITWAKKSPMPESVRDRPTSATEMVYLLAKQPTYFWDAEAVRQPNTDGTLAAHAGKPLRRYAEHAPLGTIPPGHPTEGHPENHHRGLQVNGDTGIQGANLRNFWLLGPEPLKAQHYAAYPTKLVEPCVLAGTSARGQCPACRAPWRRVVTREPDNTGYPNGPGGNQSPAPVVEHMRERGSGGNVGGSLATVARWQSTTTGWAPTCADCGIIRCQSCQYEGSYATQGRGGTASIREAAQSYEECRPCVAAETSTGEESPSYTVSSVSTSVQGETTRSLLQSDLFDTMDVGTGTREPPTTGGEHDAISRGRQAGAPQGNGADIGAPIAALGSSPPRERRQVRQPTREPNRPHADSAYEVTQQTTCPQCGASADVAWPTPIPQTVLDIFLGSGTTAYVARHHGRRAIGIELNEEYAQLAADRLRQGTLGLEIY